MAEARPYLYVDSGEALSEVEQAIKTAEWVAVDTESDSMYSYFEKVCLIQLATPERAFIIDPLSLDRGLECLGPMFARKSCRKVLHGADYDVVCLKRDFDFTFRNVFDTMIAAQFLDLDRFGLADLVAENFGVTLDKRHARTNWARRPLSQEELEYSYLDVKYLIDLAKILEEQLRAADILEEAQLEFRRLEARVPTPRNFDADGYLKIRGARSLGEEERSVLRELFILRDKQARRADRPPFKVLANDTMLRIARERPRDLNSLSRLKGVTRYVLKRHGTPILRAVARGVEKGAPPARRKKPAGRRLSPRQQRQLERLKEWRKDQAEELGVPNIVVLPNHAMMEVVIAGPRTIQKLGALETVGAKRARVHGRAILELLRN